MILLTVYNNEVTRIKNKKKLKKYNTLSHLISLHCIVVEIHKRNRDYLSKSWLKYQLITALNMVVNLK